MRVLLACSDNGHNTVTELPHLLRQAGLHVTLFCSRTVKQHVGSYAHRWTECSDHAEGMIPDIATLLGAENFDWIMLGDDALLRALATSNIDPALKARMAPIAPGYLGLGGSKVENARACEKMGIPTLPFRVCDTKESIAQAAQEIGFPVMAKIDCSGGGEGVFKCESLSDIAAFSPHWPKDQRFLVEKYIHGQPIGVEALYIKGQLVAYIYGVGLSSEAQWGVFMRRHYTPAPFMQKPLQELGKNFGLNGFVNLSYIKDHAGQHCLIEMDARPNAWISYGKFVGVDFAKALRQHLKAPGAVAHNKTSHVVSIFYREVPHFIRTRDVKGLLYWLSNTNGCLGTLPFYDPRFLLHRMNRITKPIGDLAMAIITKGPQKLVVALSKTEAFQALKPYIQALKRALSVSRV